MLQKNCDMEVSHGIIFQRSVYNGYMYRSSYVFSNRHKFSTNNIEWNILIQQRLTENMPYINGYDFDRMVL